MKNKKMKKLIVFCFTLLVMIFYCYNFVEATVGIGAVDEFTGNPDGAGLPQSIVGMILSAIRIVAAGSAAIAITVMGIRYMAAAPTERAEIKDQMIRFTLGVILVVGATEVVQALKDVAGRITP